MWWFMKACACPYSDTCQLGCYRQVVDTAPSAKQEICASWPEEMRKPENQENEKTEKTEKQRYSRSKEAENACPLKAC